MGLAQRSSLRITVWCGLFLFLAAMTANAQFRAAVQGSVTDPQGGIVVGATVTLTSKETNRAQQTTTGDEGFYRFTGLAPGSYTLSVEASGFGRKTLENVAVNAEETQGVNVTLETQGLSETITVTDVLTPPLETENANLGKAITTQEVKQLPQFGRDPYELLRLTPGVFGQGARGGSGGSVNLPNQTGPGGSNRAIFQTENQVQIVANGQRVSANNYQIDGTSVNSLTHGGAAIITPNQESVKEVRVIANNYSAEYGRNSGAQVLTVSQNGTNDFHGSLFLKNNSPGLNSFNKYGGFGNAPPQRVNQRLNQFGGSLGGPLPLPRFGEGRPPGFKLGRNRAFFFFSYEGLRSSNTDSVNAYVETPEFRNQILQARPNSIAARILGASGIAPRISAVIPTTCAAAGFNTNNCRNVAGGLDLGSPAGATGQYISFANLQGGGFDNIPDLQFAQLSVPGLSRGNQYNPRLDFNFTDRDTLTISSYFSRFNGLGSDTAGRSRPMGDIRTAPENTFVTLSYTRTLSPTMLNEARFNATRYAYNEIESSNETPFNLPRIEIETYPGDRLRFGPPRAETTPGIFAENTFEFRDTLRWVRGTHGLSFGGEIRREQDNNNLSGGARPLFTFAGLFNFANDAPLFYSINADPRTGGPAEAQRYFRTGTYAFFVQDDWKARPNLTLNIGLRYEYYSPLREKRGRLSNFILGPSGGQELTGGRIAVVDELYESDKNNFAPRLGFAYSPTKILGTDFTNKMVIRGGFGIAYNRLPVNVFENTRGNPPFFARYNICCGTASPQDFSTPFAGGQILYALGASNSPFSYPVNPALALTFNPTTGIPVVRPGSEVEIYGAPADVATPYVYTYSLETQYSLPGNMTAEVGYQGSSSHKLVRLVDQRFLYPNDRDNFFASRIVFPLTDTNANYNAMLLRLTRRFAQGFQFDAHYRWSKSIDVVSSEQVGAPNPTYPLDPRQERGPSDFDVRHHFVASGLWDLPIFRTRQDALGKILGGWQISGILTRHTGFPWTPLLSDCVSTRGPNLCPARPSAYFGGVGNDSSNEAFISGRNTVNCPTTTDPVTGQRMNPCFSLNTPLTEGRAGAQLPGIGRNVFRGPRYFNIDMSAAKRFGLPGFLGDAASFEFKANFFNAFNILNLQQFGFNSASTVITNPNFGRAERALAGRVIELQGRLIF